MKARPSRPVLVADSSRVDGEDWSIAETKHGVLHRGGHGINLIQEAELTFTRAMIRTSMGVGIFLDGRRANLSNLVIEEIGPRECALDNIETLYPCDVEPGGIGIVARGVEATVRRFTITNSHLAGLQLVGETNLELSDGSVHDNPIGINLQIQGYPLDKLTNRVVFDNATNLDARDLPVPELPSGL